MESFRSDKGFRMWEYTVSHSMLLFRHTSNPDLPKNLDIIFAGVFYLEIPEHFMGISIEEPSENEIEFLLIKTKRKKVSLPDFKFYMLKSSDSESRYFIGASSCVIFENMLGYNKSSLFENEKGELIYSNLNPAAKQYQENKDKNA